MKILKKSIFIGITILFFCILYTKVKASTPDCSNPNTFTSNYDQQYCDIQKIKDQYAPAHETNKKDLTALQKQLTELSKKISSIEIQIKNFESDISKREKELKNSQDALDEKAVGQYKNSRLYDPFWSVLSAETAVDAFRKIKTMQIIAEEDRKTTEDFSQKLISLKNDKENLEKSKVIIASLKSQVAEKEKFLEGEVEKVENFLSTLSTEQNNLLALKSGSFSVSVGDAALADDYNASFTGWQSNAPSSSITVFSFGAYAGNGTNGKRNGMSQYGAWNRAKAGQDANTILQAYYNATPVHISSPATIATDVGTIPFEKQYLYGIAEMPSSWTDNNSAALKAQAIAARTFAMRSNKPICTSDSCQVYRASKVNDPSAKAWRDAVDATEGMVLPEGVSAQYVSTPGGYLDTKGWDTVCGNQGCLVSNAWDGSSPWFYKAWYTNYKYPTGFTKCKRENPWLSQADISDILNAWTVYKNGSDDDRNHIFPPDGCGGGSPFSVDEMRNKATSLGSSYSSISSVNVQQSTNGYTSQITFQTNNGQVAITGFDTGCSHSKNSKEKCNDFWSIFNLRAPGNISIKNRMFDIKIK